MKKYLIEIRPRFVAIVRVCRRGLEMIVFRKMLRTYLMDGLIAEKLRYLFGIFVRCNLATSSH